MLRGHEAGCKGSSKESAGQKNNVLRIFKAAFSMGQEHSLFPLSLGWLAPPILESCTRAWPMHLGKCCLSSGAV
eukprot:scaffold258692_cov19-Tisochrysis_lutea.AAC.2